MKEISVQKKCYRGRFAPSPTGPLHFGSLVAAVGSYLDARAHNGQWLMRIEDIDPPREVAGAADDILRTIEELGMHWDGPVVYQGARDRYYDDALQQLQQQGHLYGCTCTRKEIADSSLKTGKSNAYPGTCRNGLPPGREARALRVRVNDSSITVNDRLQPALKQCLETETGDFIVRRADKLIAYQLAVVVDDADQDITHVVRGVDLYASTPRQVHLQTLLGYPTPGYLHLPVAVNGQNEKLNKQTHARHIGQPDSLTAVTDVLRFLGQPLPDSVEDASLDELWKWAIAHWAIESLPDGRQFQAPDIYI